MLKLEFDDEVMPVAQLFGLSSHVRDYRLCWSLNRALDIELQKQKTEPDAEAFVKFRYSNDDSDVCYTLIQNRTATGFIFPELKQADFLFFIQFGEDSQELEHYSALQSAQFMNAVFSLDPNTWNEAFRLIDVDGY